MLPQKAFSCLSNTETRSFAVLGMNALMPRGSLVWRNQAGNPDFWEVDDDEEYRELRNVKLKEEREREAAGEHDPEGDPRWTNCFVLGMLLCVAVGYVRVQNSTLFERAYLIWRGHSLLARMVRGTCSLDDH